MVLKGFERTKSKCSGMRIIGSKGKVPHQGEKMHAKKFSCFAKKERDNKVLVTVKAHSPEDVESDEDSSETFQAEEEEYHSVEGEDCGYEGCDENQGDTGRTTANQGEDRAHDLIAAPRFGPMVPITAYEQIWNDAKFQFRRGIPKYMLGGTLIRGPSTIPKDQVITIKVSRP